MWMLLLSQVISLWLSPLSSMISSKKISVSQCFACFVLFCIISTVFSSWEVAFCSLQVVLGCKLSGWISRPQKKLRSADDEQHVQNGGTGGPWETHKSIQISKNNVLATAYKILNLGKSLQFFFRRH